MSFFWSLPLPHPQKMLWISETEDQERTLTRPYESCDKGVVGRWWVGVGMAVEDS